LIGITTAEKRIMIESMKIIWEAHPVHFTILLMTIRPTRVELREKTVIQIAQSNLMVPSTRKRIVLVPEAKRTRNMPVAEATTGKTPRLRSMGLKITPPPSPSIELSTPQNNPRLISFRTHIKVHLMSPLT
jgi:hypothetical protein